MKQEHRPLRIRYANWLALSVALLGVACGAETAQPEAVTQEAAPPATAPVEPAEPAPLPADDGPAPQVGPSDLSQLDGATFVEDDTAYFIGQLLPIDGIPPIYDPQFVTADSLVDDQTGTVWEPTLGLALEGPLQGSSLRSVPYTSSYDWAWADFYPHTTVYTGEGNIATLDELR